VKMDASLKDEEGQAAQVAPCVGRRLHSSLQSIIDLNAREDDLIDTQTPHSSFVHRGLGRVAPVVIGFQSELEQRARTTRSATSC